MGHKEHPATATAKLLSLLLMAGLFAIWPALLLGKSISSSSTQMTRHDDDRLLQTMDSLAGVQFEKVIRFQQKGESFVYASASPEGSGGFSSEAIFWIAPDGGIHRIGFEHAGLAYENKVREGEFLLTGGPGILFSSGALRFEFLIANQGDPRCCPTAGKISGTYKVTGEEHFDPESREYSSTFQLVVDRCKRDIVRSGELTGDTRDNQ